MLRGDRNKAFLLLKKSLDDAFRKSYAEDHQVLFDSPTYTRLKELLDARVEEMVKNNTGQQDSEQEIEVILKKTSLSRV